MFFGKKEDKKKLPDLPPPKGSFGSIGAIEGVNRESLFEDGLSENSLPSFPDSPGHNKFSQAIIKDAVSDKNDENGGEASEAYEEDGSKIMEMEEWKPSNFKANLPKGKKDFELEEPDEEIEEGEEKDENEAETEEMEEKIEEPPKFVKREYKPIKGEDRMEDDQRMNKDIFVKIDKFYSARKSLQEIRGKFEEMNELMRKIREIKLREEQELSMWEKEMGHIKLRIQHVTENIFEKID